MWTDDTGVRDSCQDFDFAYDSPEYSKEFASIEFAKGLSMGSYVSLAVHVTEVRPSWTKEQDPYLLVAGLDADHNPTGSLRLWMFEAGDVLTGRIYFIRGLKVRPEQVWSNGVYTRSAFKKRLESGDRTAVEDVTDNMKVARYWKQP